MKPILGIGNAITDIPVFLPDKSLLEVLELPVGSMNHIDAQKERQIWEMVRGMALQYIPGGSAANTIVTAVQLGMKGGFIGKTGSDAVGYSFAESLRAEGVKAVMTGGRLPGGKAYTFFTGHQNGVAQTGQEERTFAVYPGAALEFKPEELSVDMFDGYGYLHVEGYLLQCPGVVEKAMEIAAGKGITISFDLGSVGMALRYRSTVEHLLREYVDIVFANGEEAEALTGAGYGSAAGALYELLSGKKNGIAVVKLGDEGSVVQWGAGICSIGAVPARVLDTTGAGDAYAAGFLYAHSCGADIRTCGNAGSLLASKAIEVVGPRMPKESTGEILRKVLGK